MVKMKNMSLIKWWLFFILLFGLVGCSSGKGNSSDSNGLKAEESNELYSRIAIEVSGGEIPLHIAKTRDENLYVVTESMAISSKAVNIDNAKEYIKIALGEECQSAINTTSGFKVNRKGLANCERSYFDILSAGEYKSFLNEADFDKYLQETIKYLETVNEPINVDYIFDDIMIGQLNDFVYGDVTLDSAVDSTIEKIQLYLSE